MQQLRDRVFADLLSKMTADGLGIRKATGASYGHRY